MNRRRLLCGLLLATAVLAYLWIASGPRVSRERFEQVKKGMSRKEVVQMLGEPVGGTGVAWPYSEVYYWVCDDAELLVLFDDAGIATRVEFESPPLHHTPPTLTERIRRWLGL
jgi:hypothetical protein